MLVCCSPKLISKQIKGVIFCIGITWKWEEHGENMPKEERTSLCLVSEQTDMYELSGETSMNGTDYTSIKRGKYKKYSVAWVSLLEMISWEEQKHF